MLNRRSARGDRRTPVIAVAVVAVVLALSPLLGLSSAARSGPTGGPEPAAFSLLANAAAHSAQQPAPTSPTTPPTGRAFVANETGGAISVIDAATGAIVGTYCLGSDREDDVAGTPAQALVGPCDQEQDHHRPLYDGHAGPHGAWLTPDGRVLLIANRLSGTIVALDTSVDPAQSCEAPLPPTPCVKATLGYTPTGREPHLATVHPNGQEAWVATRGERFVEVLKLDPALLFGGGRPIDRMPRIATIDTLIGPSMVSFTPDGRHAFVVHAKAPVVQKIDAVTRQVVASRAVPAPFTPFGLVTPDGAELYAVHKNAGTLSILRTGDLEFVVQGLPIGPRANHVYFVGNLAYVTIGGPAPGAAAPNPLGGLVIINRQTHAIVAASPGFQGRPDVPAYVPSGSTADWSGEPHGIWATADGRRLFVGHERGNRVTILDTGNPNDPLDDTFVADVTEPLMKQPIDVVVNSAPTGGEATPTASPAATATNTPAAVTPQATNTAAIPSASATSTGTPTATVKPSATPTRTPTPTSTASPTPLRGNATARVGICHVTGSDSNPYRFLEVSESAAAAHLEHGDLLGADSQTDCPTTPPSAAAERQR